MSVRLLMLLMVFALSMPVSTTYGAEGENADEVSESGGSGDSSGKAAEEEEEPDCE